LRIPRKANEWSRSAQTWLAPAQSGDHETLPSYSASETFSQKDFSRFSDEEVEEAVKIIRKLAALLATRLSRRYQSTHQRRFIDFRKTIRFSLRSAGEPMDLSFRKRSMKRARIVVLCDVSGSMERYSRFLIVFLYSLQQVYGRVETFVFSTSLHRVTEIFKRRTLRKALEEISALIPDWSGGTRIGACLRTFLAHFGNALLTRDTVVLVLSDGWDVGEVDSMEEGMKQIRRRVRRVLWLNPLLGDPDYEPACIGMQTALPYLDDFVPAHNLDSLSDLCRRLVAERKRKGIAV
jgi:hypothetical protein